MTYLKQITLFIPMMLFIFVAGYFKGNIDAKHKYEISNLKDQVNQNTIINKINDKIIAQKESAIVKTIYITKEVIKYVNTPNANIILDANWVWLYHNSISDAEASRKSYATTAGIAIDTITKNNQTCVQWRNQIILLQEWIRENGGK